MVRKMMVKILSMLESDVSQAADGKVAIDIIRDKLSRKNASGGGVKRQKGNDAESDDAAPAMPYDVILMDSVMPKVSGIEATKVIVQELGFSNLVVGVTGNILPADTTGSRHSH